MSKAFDESLEKYRETHREFLSVMDYRAGFNAAIEAAAKLLDEKAAGCRGYSSETVFILAAEDVRNLTAEGKR